MDWLVKFSRGLFNSIKEKNMYDVLKSRIEIESKFENVCAKASLSMKDEMT
jgi:hypothetical protein